MLYIFHKLKILQRFRVFSDKHANTDMRSWQWMQNNVEPKRKVHKKEQNKNDEGKKVKECREVNSISLTFCRFHQFVRALAYAHPKSEHKTRAYAQLFYLTILLLIQDCFPLNQHLSWSNLLVRLGDPDLQP